MLSFFLVDVDADASDQSWRVFALLSPRYINGESPTLMAELWRKELEITRIKRHFQIIYMTKEGFVLMIGSELFFPIIMVFFRICNKFNISSWGSITLTEKNCNFNNKHRLIAYFVFYIKMNVAITMY